MMGGGGGLILLLVVLALVVSLKPRRLLRHRRSDYGIECAALCYQWSSNG